MTTKTEQVSNEIYKETRMDLLERQLSNSVIHDRAILTLSTSALGISLAFIKNIVPIDVIQCTCLLIASWWLFGSAIISTMASFMVSQMSIKKQLEYAKKYYLDKQTEYQNKTNKCAKSTEFLNWLSCLTFGSAIIATIIFVTINL